MNAYIYICICIIYNDHKKSDLHGVGNNLTCAGISGEPAGLPVRVGGR